MPAAAALATSRGRQAAVALATAAAGIATVLVMTTLAILPRAAAAPMAGLPCPVSGVSIGAGEGAMGLDADQIRNAQVIIAIGQSMGVPVRGQVVAITAALQESGIRNLDHGDRDSLGLFQMRPSQGWGTKEEILNPGYAARKFYTVLLGIDGWQNMSVNDAAQAVERSAFPNAYAKHQRRAVQIVASIGGSTADARPIDTSGCQRVASAPNTATQEALQVMLQQVGKPYVWGATGPDSFDCSGLIVYGWQQAGYRLKVRTSQQMHAVATPIKAGQERPGDLIFTNFGEQAGTPGPAHVMIVVRPGVAVEAPRTGLDVRVREYDATSDDMTLGRLPESAMTPLSAGA